MNQRIGYARGSTEDQHLDLQRDAPELEQCRKAPRSGNTLVVRRLDRLGRSLPDLVQIVAEPERSGAVLRS